MICIATQQDGEHICEIPARTGIFSAEEVQCVAEIWQEYVGPGIETGGYTFYVENDGERVLG